MLKNLRVTLSVSTAIVALSAMVALPAGAATSTTDPSLASDTTLAGPASISGAGSTFDAPLINAAQAIYTARNVNATISSYQAVGSGTGQTDIANGLVNFGASDVPMTQANLSAMSHLTAAESSLSSYVQVPVALGGVAIGYHLPSITQNKVFKHFGVRLTGTILAKIYSGVITKWNDKAICNVNPNLVIVKKNAAHKIISKTCALPNHTITVVARSDGSGTTYAFTNYMNDVAPKLWPNVSKSEIALPSNGVNEPGNAGVAAEVANNAYTIGYIEYSYLLLNHGIAAAAIENAAGDFLQPSVTGVAAAAAQKPNVTSTDFDINNQAGATTYPISTYSWIIVRVDQQGVATSQLQATLLVKFLDWLSHSSGVSGTLDGQDVAGEQAYVPLPTNIQALAHSELLKVTYGGKPIL
jgi:phosphate transport system substrate-binding protein